MRRILREVHLKRRKWDISTHILNKIMTSKINPPPDIDREAGRMGTSSPTFVDLIVDALAPTSYPDGIPPRPTEPEQTYLLGDRYADYALCGVFAIAFPIMRSVLKYTVYAVRVRTACACATSMH